MRRRTNPWPAFVDLFSALLVAAFAGFILMTSSGFEKSGTGSGAGKPGRPPEEPPTTEEVVSAVRKEANQIMRDLEEKLEEGNLQAKVIECGEDACLDLFIHYPRNLADIPPDQQQQVTALGDACQVLHDALDRLEAEKPVKKREVEIIVEGHADRTQPKAKDPKVAYLTNWTVSAQRAASVLWEFQQCGLVAPEYSVSMIGFADSERICHEPTEECDRMNRRTTLRLRASTQKIAERLGAGQN